MKWTAFLVYGSFSVPNTDNLNFIIVRMPAGRVPWSKKIAPAINRLVKPWHRPGDREKFWDIDGDDEKGSLWAVTLTRKFEWNGAELREV
jgi:hypothetical protein